MIQDSFNNSSDYSVAEEPTLYYDGDGVQRRKPHDPKNRQQQNQEELRHSNRDSGISSEKQRQQLQPPLQQQQQPKITQHMSRFLSDTMKSSQSFERDHTRRNGQKDSMDCSMSIDGKVLNKKAQQYIELADDWEQRKVLKERQHQKAYPRSSPPISSLPPTSNMQEGARGEKHPTRFSDRLTPEIEILQENNNNEKQQNRQQRSNYENNIPRKEFEERRTNFNHYQRRASESRRPFEDPHRKYQLNVRPLSRSSSRQQRDYSSCDSCTSSRKCCHHTYYYVCNHPNDRYNSENHFDRHRSYKPTFKNTDDIVLKKLALMAAECTQIKRLSKTSRKYFDDDNVLPRYDRRFDKKTVEFGSIDSGIEGEPFEKQKTELPTLITSHTIMSLLNFNKRYEFLTNLARNILIQRKNVRNFVAEFEAALNRHADLLKRYISRLELQLPKANSPKYSKLEKEIAEARKNLYICEEKAKEFEAVIQRDKNTWQKLPEGNASRAMPHLDYQRRLIYEIFMT